MILLSYLTECLQSRSSTLYSSLNYLTSQGSWFHSFVKEATFVLPLPLPFLSSAILDLGTRSSRSGGVL